MEYVILIAVKVGGFLSRDAAALSELQYHIALDRVGPAYVPWFALLPQDSIFPRQNGHHKSSRSFKGI